MSSQLKSWESAINYGSRMYKRGFVHGMTSIAAAVALFFVAGIMFGKAQAADVLSLSNIYIDGSLAYSTYGEGRMVSRTTQYDYIMNKYGEKIRTIPYTVTQYQFDNSAQNPYARISIGYDIQWSPKWLTRLDLSHESSIATGQDHGEERITLGVVWRPFAN